jgi:hypothetical protein
MFRKAMLVICILILLSACNTKATPTPTPLAPTDTVPVHTATLQPTSTRRPTPTEWPTVPPRPTPTPYPVGRGYSFIVYSPKADRALMYNGTTVESLGSSSNEAWLFDPQTMKWSEAQKVPFGCEWYDPGGVYDSQADRFLLYCSGESGNIMEYDFETDTWSDRKAANTPSGAHNTRMAYDSESQKTILFGGIQFSPNGTQFEGTWAYDYTTNAWTKMNPKTQPPGLYAHTLDYDSESDRVIYWGGSTWTGYWGSGAWSSIPTENLVWAYDYNTDTWESHPVTDGPSKPVSSDYLQYIASVYVPDLDRILYYWDGQLWLYDYNHNAWEKAKGGLLLKPGTRIAHGMAYLSSIKRVLVFGGDKGMYMWSFPEDTWLYDPQTGDWTQVGP